MKRRGHNLLEMILATLIFLTVSTALIMVWIQHARSMSASGGRLVGQHLAQEVLEECVAAGYYNVNALEGVQAPIFIYDIIRDESKQTRYDVNVTVVPVPAKNWKVVRVLVQWDDALGRSRIEFKTQLAKHA